MISRFGVLRCCANAISGQVASVSSFQSKDLVVERALQGRRKPAVEELVFGKYFADHMLVCDYIDGKWKAPQILPHQNFSLPPSITGLHYAIQCFEGMKAYKTAENDVRLFRPDLNIARMKRTAAKLTLPDFEAEEFLVCLKKLVELDADWVPDISQSASLYIRPTFISIDPVIGVRPPSSARLFVITGPVGPYYEQKGTELFQAVKLMADPQFVRAWEGGIGAYKAGGNYAPTLSVQRVASERGCQQVLWLYGKEQYMTEAGTMNFFVHWINEKGERELTTAPLDTGLILPGVTRQSVLDLTREWGEFKVTERMLTMAEFIEAVNTDRIIEVFGCGTACMIAPIDSLLYEGKDINVPTMTSGAELSKRLFNELSAIQKGEVDHPWSVSVHS